MDKHQHYDIVIIGGGLGGLLCGAILSKEGMNVCIVERNEQVGGCLQTFRRNHVIFDTGIHYIGGLDKGQNLYQLFNYLGLIERLALKKMDEKGFDVILFKDDERQYPHGMGYENFIESLTLLFPDEKAAIIRYCERIKQTCATIPLYNFKADEHYDDIDAMELNAKEEIEKLTTNTTLRAVLAGSNMLYIGNGDKTPWNVHALIMNSYIESSWRCEKTGEQIAKLLAKSIRAQGGTILTKAQVNTINEQDEAIKYIALADGTQIVGKQFISNLHPANTIEMVDSKLLKAPYKNRIKSLENSVSAFVLNIAMKPNSYQYTNRNYYYHESTDVWTETTYTDDSFPLTYGIFEAVPEKGSEYLEAVSIMTYMKWDEVQQWESTYNNVISPENRGTEYESFKKLKAEKLLAKVANKFPELVANIDNYYVSTPLTYRDYLNTPSGSIYGISKDCTNPIKTLISPTTKIPNLYLTGQNLKLHGVLGVALSAVVTCSAIVGREYLVNKIVAANEVGD